jgi:trehalose 6-phosphate phosphatase
MLKAVPAGTAMLERLAAEPQLAGLFLDFDGVLAPIVDRPDDAYPTPEARRELERLASRYALVAVVSGRAGDDVRQRVDVDGVVIAGSHGLELDPDAEGWRDRIEAFADGVEWPDVERKTLTVAFHYRTEPDERAARAVLEDVARRARAAGLRASFGRKVLEVLPPLDANKGTAVRQLLSDAGLRRALVAGDDTTDLDAFHALDGLELAVRVAVAADESPPELRATADIVVGSTEELLALLRKL